MAPAAVLEAVEAYRAAFKPSGVLAEPKVMVSADVVVADDDETARRLASPYRHWVRSIRTGQGAIPFPSESDAAALDWTDDVALTISRRRRPSSSPPPSSPGVPGPGRGRARCR
ncbi:hypothetical protein [Actinoplanes sp. NPDC089786]|uniref:hypothetical protein n=1 Tax=Actinoplanes sp. NPDC089786 TaxID=3155185 RepID=UPI003427B552